MVVGGSALTLAALGASCAGTVVGGDDSGEGGNVSTQSSQSGTPTQSGQPTTSSGTTGSNAVVYGSDPGRVTIRAMSRGLTCADPTQDPPFEECDWAVLEITVPAAQFVVGAVFGPESPDCENFMQEYDAAGPDGTCAGGGGGGALFGTVEIVSIDPSGVHLVLDGYDTFFFDHFEPDGSVTAENCL